MLILKDFAFSYEISDKKEIEMRSYSTSLIVDLSNAFPCQSQAHK